MWRSNSLLRVDLSLARVTCAMRLILTVLPQNMFFYMVQLSQMGRLYMVLTLLSHDNKSYDFKNPRNMNKML